jgi:hypothetical protein
VRTTSTRLRETAPREGRETILSRRPARPTPSALRRRPLRRAGAPNGIVIRVPDRVRQRNLAKILVLARPVVGDERRSSRCSPDGFAGAVLRSAICEPSARRVELAALPAASSASARNA